MDERSQQWLNRMREENHPILQGAEWGLHLQEWLAKQDTEESGCPLVDNPPIFGAIPS